MTRRRGGMESPRMVMIALGIASALGFVGVAGATTGGPTSARLMPCPSGAYAGSRARILAERPGTIVYLVAAADATTPAADLTSCDLTW